MFRSGRFILILLAPLVFSACTTNGVSSSTTAIGVDMSKMTQPELQKLLSGYRWHLVTDQRSEDEELTKYAASSPSGVVLSFTASEDNTGKGRLGAKGDCNNLFTGYSLAPISNGQFTLTVNDFASTMMACIPDKMKLDDLITNRFKGDSMISVQQIADVPVLIMTNAKGKTYRFNGEPTPETKYGGTGEKVFLEVASKKIECPDSPPAGMTCLKVRDVTYDEQGLLTKKGEWRSFSDKIEGYTHTDGTYNVLRLKKYEQKGKPPVYVLDMIVETGIE